jgi:pyruvate formate lyase activating enzyme
MHIKGWVRSSLLDYPGHIAASLFCGGCNFRCPNCQNGTLVADPQGYPDIPEKEIELFLEGRKGLLDGVVISGGEPTLQGDLMSFAERVRDAGFLVKLDTNGYRPDVLEALVDAGVVDYVAMDVKAPLARYTQAAGVRVDVVRIQRSLDLLREGRVSYEFRTTVVPGMLFEADIAQMARLIAGASQYYLQQFVPQNTLDPEMLERVPYPAHRIYAMADLARQWVDQVGIRGP